MMNRVEIEMSKMLTCSVAMTTYNGEKYIEQQLCSIMNQTHVIDEVVITDDGSSDDTVRIVRDFICKNHLSNWMLICNENNLGYTANFEKCISKCCGDIIFLCDQDDVWYPDKVSRILAVFESNEDCLSVATNFHLIDSKGDRITNSANNDNCWCYSKKLKYISDNLYQVDITEVLNHNIAPGCTQALRRSLVNGFLYDGYNTIHDYRITLLASLIGHMYYLDLPLVMYRIHENNSVGYPDYCLMRKKKERSKIFKSYFIYIYNLIHKQVKLEYNRREKIRWLRDNYKDNPDVIRWIDFAENREKLFSDRKHKIRYYFKQMKYRRERKTVTYTNDRYERFTFRMNDIAAIWMK